MQKTCQCRPSHVDTVFVFWLLTMYWGKHCLYTISLVDINSNVLDPSNTLMLTESFTLLYRICSDVNSDMLHAVLTPVNVNVICNPRNNSRRIIM